MRSSWNKSIILLAAIFLCVAISSTSTSASAAGLKVGVVDIEYVILKSKRGKAVKRRLKALFTRKQKDLNKQQQNLLKLKKRLENPSAVDSKERRRKTLLEYQKGLVKLQERFVKHQQELAKRERKLMKPLFAKLEVVLKGIATKGGFDLILARSQYGVVFRKESLDVTDKVLKALNSAG